MCSSAERVARIRTGVSEVWTCKDAAVRMEPAILVERIAKLAVCHEWTDVWSKLYSVDVHSKALSAQRGISDDKS